MENKVTKKYLLFWKNRTQYQTIIMFSCTKMFWAKDLQVPALI